jgi:hypothetical protein
LAQPVGFQQIGIVARIAVFKVIETHPNGECRVTDWFCDPTQEEAPTDQIPVSVGTNKKNVSVAQQRFVNLEAGGVDLVEFTQWSKESIPKIRYSNDFQTTSEAPLVEIETVAELSELSEWLCRPSLNFHLVHRD